MAFLIRIISLELIYSACFTQIRIIKMYKKKLRKKYSFVLNYMSRKF